MDDGPCVLHPGSQLHFSDTVADQLDLRWEEPNGCGSVVAQANQKVNAHVAEAAFAGCRPHVPTVHDREIILDETANRLRLLEGLNDDPPAAEISHLVDGIRVEFVFPKAFRSKTLRGFGPGFNDGTWSTELASMFKHVFQGNGINFVMANFPKVSSYQVGNLSDSKLICGGRVHLFFVLADGSGVLLALRHLDQRCEASEFFFDEFI